MAHAKKKKSGTLWSNLFFNIWCSTCGVQVVMAFGRSGVQVLVVFSPSGVQGLMAFGRNGVRTCGVRSRGVRDKWCSGLWCSVATPRLVNFSSQ